MSEKEIVELIIQRIQNTIEYLEDHPEALGKSAVYSSQLAMLEILRLINEERKS
jgi:hypothetical protein